MRILLVAFALSAIACDPNPTPSPRGAASISWSITGAGGTHQPCAAVGAASVTLTLRPRSVGGDVITSFPCADGRGVSPLVEAAPYDATLSLRSANGAPIAVGPTQRSVIVTPNATVALAPVAFDVATTTALELSMSALDTQSNCGATSAGGAGITATAIALESVDANRCMPATLLRVRDGKTIGAYTVSCFRPQAGACIERDETLTTATLPPGDYTVRVSGLRDGVLCWRAARAFTIPGGTLLTSEKLQLAPVAAPGC